MINFIDKSDYQKPTFKQISPTEIEWVWLDEQNRTHSGGFLKSQKSNHLRDGIEFEPFAEVLELGLVPDFDQLAYDEQLASEQKELKRLELKSKRESDLQAITHDFGDGRIVQIRPQDIGNFQLAIAKNQTMEWIMENNTVAELTIAELQTAFDSGVTQGEQIYNDYMTALKTL